MPALGRLYQDTLRTLDLDDPPAALFGVYAGDRLAGNGAHYTAGRETKFSALCHTPLPGYSDDFLENAAMLRLCGAYWPLHPDGLRTGRNRLARILAPHFANHPDKYSPLNAELMRVSSRKRYMQLARVHSSCGAAMRTPCLAAADITSGAQAFRLLGITHMHPEAMEGAFWLLGLGRALKTHVKSRAGLYKCAAAAAREGRRRSRNWLKSYTGSAPPSYFRDSLARVFRSGDPRAAITDIHAEGIETRFVVPAVALILDEMLPLPAHSAVPQIVEHALKTGGDPDTIASIALGLYSLSRPQETCDFLDELEVTTGIGA